MGRGNFQLGLSRFRPCEAPWPVRLVYRKAELGAHGRRRAAVTGWLHAQLSAGRLSTGQLTRLIIALDGKTVRGAKDAAGNQLHLFAALVHGEATVIAQHPVDSKTNELSGFIPLLDQIAEHHDTEPDQHNDDRERDDNSDSEEDGSNGGPGKLHGVIVTADALHTQRAHARYLRKHGGEYVLIAKGNQPNLFAALDDLPWTTIEVGHTEEDKGHGRRDRRVLKVIDLTDPAHAHHRVCFPGTRQTFLIERYRHFPDGTMTAAAILGITSLTPKQASPADLADIIRGHWHIEAHHHVRVTFKEDASRIRAGAGARVMAIIRNVVISLLHRTGYHNIAEGRRAAAWDRNRLALDILGL